MIIIIIIIVIVIIVIISTVIIVLTEATHKGKRVLIIFPLAVGLLGVGFPSFHWLPVRPISGSHPFPLQKKKDPSDV